MAYIFLDESGDLGFDLTKKRTSRYFLIIFLCCSNKRVIDGIVSKTHAELKKQHKMRGGILHCARKKPITRQRLLRRLAEKDCAIMTVYLDKKKVYTKMINEKIILYNYIANILLDRIMTKELLGTELDKIILVASRRETNKFLNENFKFYLQDMIRGNHGIDITVEVKTVFEEKSLQAVDFASWAIFRKQEYADDRYYNLIKHRIIEENPLFT
jgi:hypothetical protein